MKDEPATALSDLLAYLGDLGYGEIYRRAPAAHPGPASTLPVALAQEVREVSDGEPAASPADRLTALSRLAVVAAGCHACRLCETRNKVVFGAGDPAAQLMFVGEGPGAEEDKQGLPFVGRAGELLTRIIQAMELQRSEVYIANVVKCRPPGNREPQPDEVAAGRHFLEGQIGLIAPRVLVALGRTAAQTLLGNDESMARMRGKWYELFGVPMMVTYHPAALLRNPALKRPTWDDMQLVRDRLRSPT